MDLSIFIFCAGVALLILVLIAVCDVSVEGHKRPAPSRIPCPPKLIMAPGIKYQRLTIKAIIRWEQLREKSFSQMNYTLAQWLIIRQ